MSRASFLLLAATISLVLCSARQSAEAGPVTLGLEAYDELASVTPQAEESGSSVVNDDPVEVQPPPAVQDGILAGGSMTGSPSSTVTAGATGGAAISSPVSDVEPSFMRLYVLQDGWVFPPPRFMDGVFRPPRTIVSL